MKSIKTIMGTLLLTLGAISIASCSQEEDNTVMQEGGNLLKICTSIADTRNVIMGTTFKDGDEIGICVTTPDGQAYTDHSLNIRATYSNGNWKLDQNVMLTDKEAFVYAYYPYDKEATDSIDIDLTPDHMNRPGQTDYLQGSCLGLNANKTTANIRFKHALSRITLAITKGAEDVGEGVISRVRIENNLMYYSGQYVGERPTKRDTKIAKHGKMSIKTGERRNITSTEDYFVEVPTNCTINTSEAQNIDILLLPFSCSPIQVNTWRGYGVSVVLTIDGEEYKFPLETIPDNEEVATEGAVVVELHGSSWEAGKQYTYPITVNRKTAITPTVTPGEKVYMGFNGDNGKPLYWSSYNLGATSPEEYGGLYGWADPTGKKTSTNLNDYPSANPPTDISGTEYDIARQMWGDNWRIPSNGEMWSLLSNSTEEWTTLNGVQGVKYTSEKNGNTIFFPVAPIRKGNVVQYESATYYWLDGLNKDDHTLAGTFYIYKGSNLLDYPTAGEQRYMGLPIRPVTE